MPNQVVEPFICRGCGRPIDKLAVTTGHSVTCPYWGTIGNARIDRDSLHELLRTATACTEQHRNVREAAYAFANAILSSTPHSVGQQLALRQVRDALVTTNVAIAEAQQVQPPAGPKEAVRAQSSKELRTGGRRLKTVKKKAPKARGRA